VGDDRDRFLACAVFDGDDVVDAAADAETRIRGIDGLDSHGESSPRQGLGEVSACARIGRGTRRARADSAGQLYQVRSCVVGGEVSGRVAAAHGQGGKSESGYPAHRGRLPRASSGGRRDHNHEGHEGIHEDHEDGFGLVPVRLRGLRVLLRDLLDCERYFTRRTSPLNVLNVISPPAALFRLARIERFVLL